MGKFVNVAKLGDIWSYAEARLSEGEPDGHVITCPLHGARFDVRTGEVLSMPALAPVDTSPLRVEGGDIEVDPDLS